MKVCRALPVVFVKNIKVIQRFINDNNFMFQIQTTLYTHKTTLYTQNKPNDKLVNTQQLYTHKRTLCTKSNNIVQINFKQAKKNHII